MKKIEKVEKVGTEIFFNNLAEFCQAVNEIFEKNPGAKIVKLQGCRIINGMMPRFFRSKGSVESQLLGAFCTSSRDNMQKISSLEEVERLLRTGDCEVAYYRRSHKSSPENPNSEWERITN